MELTPFENNLKKIACALGILQGAGYGLLALICIILYNKDDLLLSYSTYWDRINFNMYYLYLGPNFRIFPDQVLYPRTFTAFVWVYFILSLVWIGISIETYYKKGVAQPKLIRSWSHLTLFIALWDFITVVILGVDYHRCQNALSVYNPLNDFCATGILPVLVIAAKGFVLWIVNVIFGVILNNMAVKLKKGFQAHIQQLQAQHMQIQVQQVAMAPSTMHQSPSFTGSYPLQLPASHANAYMGPPRQPSPHMTPPAHNAHKNQADYPVFIPDPDYHYRQQVAQPNRRY